MDNKSRKRTLRKFMPDLVIVLLGIAVILFWRARGNKVTAPFEEKALPKVTETKKEEPAEPAKVVLRSALAGRWYPANAETLSKQIDGLFQTAQAEPISNVIALILPHAGYRFSGQTAASGLKTTEKEYKRVVIIGPSHGVLMEEILSVPRVTRYQTPLGQTPLDVEFINRLLEYSVFQNIPQAHMREHSVQIELPLLQHSRKNFKLVPIVAGSCSLKTIEKAGTILKSMVDEDTLVIASSDFTHYGRPHGYVPFTENIPEKIKKLDMGAYEHIARMDSKGFLEYKRRTRATICGYIPIAILLSMLDRNVEARLVKYTTSGEMTGDFTNSVSYLSVAFSGEWQNCPKIEPEHRKAGLTEQDKKQLLILARKTIVDFLEKRRVPQPSELGVTISDTMREPRAAFVTLKKDSQLRGCIGDTVPWQPLYRSVIRNAINAAVNDRRFLSVTKDEFNDITIEISALTVPEPIASAEQIRIGIDGVILNKDGRSAVFLPQVAPENGWDVNQTLTRLSLKAGLPADAWKEGANFLVFQADVFGEGEE